MKNKIHGKEKIKTKSTVHDLDNQLMWYTIPSNSGPHYISTTIILNPYGESSHRLVYSVGRNRNVQQHNTVWTTDNYLSVVSTIIESLGSTHNDRGQVAVVVI